MFERWPDKMSEEMLEVMEKDPNRTIEILHVVLERDKKDIQLKAWPELTAYHASSTRFERSSANQHTPFIDFSGCREISTTGLTVWLLRILKFIKKSPNYSCYSTNSFSNNLLYNIRQLFTDKFLLTFNI